MPLADVKRIVEGKYVKKEDAQAALDSLEVQPIFYSGKGNVPDLLTLKPNASIDEIRATTRKTIKDTFKSEQEAQSLRGAAYNPKHAEGRNVTVGNENWSLFGELTRPHPPPQPDVLRSHFPVRPGENEGPQKGLR